MLALTRRVGEEVVIGDPRQPLGVIRIVDIHGDKVRLSFDFPRDMQINRRELAEQKAKQAGPLPGPAPAPGAQTPGNNGLKAPESHTPSAPPTSPSAPPPPAPESPKP